MRSVLARLLVPVCLLAAPVVLAGAARAQPRGHVDVIEVSGLIDAVQVDFVRDALRAAEGDGAEALVLQLDSGGAVAGREALDVLRFRIAHAGVPVAVWVGPSGASAEGGAYDLALAAPVRGAAPGTELERPFAGPNVVNAPTLGDFVVGLDGRQIAGRVLRTAEVVREPGSEPRRRPVVDVRFTKPGLTARVLHTVSSPAIAYLLWAVGLGLVVFELYTAGIGVAAFTGAVCLVLAAFGFAALPTRAGGLALVTLGVLAYAVDVQAGAPRAWTAIATLALTVGSLVLYGQGLTPSPLVIGVVVAGMALFMVRAMPSVVRARFSTPTIGRDWMVGETGAALVDVAPEGTVEVRGAPWRARTNRATPIAAGAPVRVTAIDGLVLQVEPLEGGARDYRRH